MKKIIIVLFTFLLIGCAQRECKIDEECVFVWTKWQESPCASCYITDPGFKCIPADQVENYMNPDQSVACAPCEPKFRDMSSYICVCDSECKKIQNKAK